MTPPSIFKILIKIYLCTPAPLARVCHHYNLIYLIVDLNRAHSASRGERPGIQGLVQTQPAQEFIWRRESRTIGSGIPTPTADWPSEVSRTPFSSQSKERKEECRGKATPESKDNASLITGASVHLTKVCCTRIASLRADNKSRTSIS